MLSDCQNLNRLSWSKRKIMVKDLRQRSGLACFCACAESCVVFNTGPYTVFPDNSILITGNMQSETGFPSRLSHQLKSYVASKSRLKLAARAVLSADVGLLVFYLLRLRRYKGKCVKTRCLQDWVGHLEPRFQGEEVVPGEYFLVSTKLDTFCYPTVQTAPCYVQSF